jgi:hypothetical protein
MNVEFTKELIALVRASGLPEIRNSSSNTTVTAGFLGKLGNPRAGWITFVFVGLLLAAWIVYLQVQKRKLETMRAAAEQSNRETTSKLGDEVERNLLLSRELEAERQKRQKAEEMLAQSQPGRSPGVLSILLTPATFERGSGNAKVAKLTANTDRIRLLLTLGQGATYERYSLLIATFGGRKVWSSDSITKASIRQGRLEVVLPGNLVEYEDYRLELQGVSDAGPRSYCRLRVQGPEVVRQGQDTRSLYSLSEPVVDDCCG